MAFEYLCVSARGASHIREGKTCEDAGLIRMDGRAIAFAIADGHGDSNCPRSALGSELAVEIAVGELLSFARSIEEEAWEERLLDQRFSEPLRRQLISSIIGLWSEAVNDNFAVRPLDVAEREGCKRYIERYDRGERIEHIYGTTLIAGLATEAYLLLLQQGDGRCVVFDMKGNVDQPIPWDERCFANVVTSLCDNDAAQSCRSYVLDLRAHPIVAVFAGSDGVDDSFLTMEMCHSFYRGLLIRADEEGVNGLQDYLEASLSEFSEKGSGDDVTIAGLVDPSRLRSLKERFEADNTRAWIDAKLEDIDARLKSMEGKLAFLGTRCDEAMNRYDSAVVRHSIAAEDSGDQAYLALAEQELEESVDAMAEVLGESEAYLARRASFVKERADLIEMRDSLPVFD